MTMKKDNIKCLEAEYEGMQVPYKIVEKGVNYED